MNRPRKHHGAHAPVLSIHVTNEFKGRSLARGRGRAKTVLGSGFAQLRDYVFRGEAVELDGLVARGVAADQVHAVAGAVQLLGQELDERLVGGGIDGRRGDFDAEFVAERVADFVGGGARLELHRQEDSVGLDAKKAWHGHWLKMNSGRARPGKLEYKLRKTMGISSTLFASLIWGSIGLGFAIYGKKQRATAPLVGGILLMGISYFIGSALVMSLVGVALVAGIVWIGRHVD